MLANLISCKARLYLGWAMLVGTAIGWPLTIWLTDEPPFILSLSWFAILLEAWNMIQIADEAADK